MKEKTKFVHILLGTLPQCLTAYIHAKCWKGYFPKRNQIKNMCWTKMSNLMHRIKTRIHDKILSREQCILIKINPTLCIWASIFYINKLQIIVESTVLSSVNQVVNKTHWMILLLSFNSNTDDLWAVDPWDFIKFCLFQHV